ncbi:carbon monoxide dehydrogenase medium subunit [Mycolicibacterium mageritense DSM 44476 = CIP 104973]|uniref:Carbon monoxide dehydrogenase medium chain n=1 Tax=Mycolicibacterium mageritense TaxID=53462 RepID=A0AAI8U1U9_MYCME|nr:xanthine dehydrogenase family protein subunit M [Mycolicibacterium mageritense]TXI65505.1 MAG: xanthine dehydrogenase family protein subunit M [Mycolicibacterium mageritense]CDO26913.1 aerobic-type carbon monoxide dehydrogenase subunit CoxM_3 [Mycolicibacterium mageritense DSM 44476 = CIP 104973]BBX38354.1 carbon-monoxide dehydrogenase medium subunit [Mycolicibacterium mageritense]BDY33015.1 Carbon monoxide dehydrogenase medium chain [Mycolicibacterium mageritense]GJJ20848.1 carbon-monoxide
MTVQETTQAGRTAASCFEYQRAESWSDAIELLELWDDEAKILAGGQSLIPMLNLRLAAPGALIDVNPIPAAAPRLDGNHIVIDANTRHRVLTTSDVVRTHAPLLSHAVRFVGNVRVRNRGTFGGTLAHADPTGEIAAVTMAMGGEIIVQGPSGTRTVPADEFFITYLTTAMEPNEVIVGGRIPVGADGRWGFHEVVRRYSDFATVSVTVMARAATDVRVVLGGVAVRPLLVDPEYLAPALSDPGNPDRARESADAIAASLDPDTDLHATADYRRRLVAVHTRRLLEQVLAEEGRTA